MIHGGGAGERRDGGNGAIASSKTGNQSVNDAIQEHALSVGKRCFKCKNKVEFARTFTWWCHVCKPCALISSSMFE